MKITCIRFQNINSLKGIHEIRFDKAPFTENGLFAIVGPTGAGKTSILDAITAALYGRVHRHDKNAYESMTRHTGESFAEVEFEVNDIIYRSRWSVRRSQGKADGNLQTAKMELSNASTGEIIISHPLALVQQTIVDTCGLDYNQFLRSVMLSQGDFTRFLKANENERSELLEKITDTGIYSDISAFVFQKAKEESVELNNLCSKLNNVKLLSEDELLLYKSSLVETQDQEKQKSEERKKYETEWQWLVSIEKLNTKKQVLQNEYDTFIKEYNENKVSFEKLHLHQQALKYQSDLARYETSEKQLIDVEKRLSEIALLLPQLIKETSELESKTKLAAEDYLNAQNIQIKMAPIIIETEKKDILIAEKKKEIEKLRAEYATIQTLYEKLESEIQRGKQEEKTLKDKIENEKLQLLDIKKEQENILSDKNAEELEKEIAHLPSLISICERQLELAIQVARDIKTQKELSDRKSLNNEQLQTEAKKLPEIQRMWQEADEYLSVLQKNVELQSKIKNYEADRKTLQLGEACPLCGSIHHPFIEENYQNELGEMEQKRNVQKLRVDELSKILNEKSILLQKLQSQQEAIGEQISQVENNVTTTRLQFQSNNEKLPKPLDIEKEEIIQAVISNKKEQQQIFSKKILSLRKIENAIRNAEISIGRLNEISIRTQSGIENNEKNKKEKITDINRLKTAIEEETLNLSNLEKERYDLFQNKNTAQERDNLEKRITEQKEISERLGTELLVKKEALQIEKSRQEDYSKSREEIAKQHQSISGNLIDNLKSNEIYSIEDLKQRFLPEAEAENLTRLFQQSEKKKTEIERSIDDTNKEFNIEITKKLTTENKTDLEESILHIGIAISRLNQEIGRINEIIKADEASKIQFRQIAIDIEKQKKESGRWEKLSKLIGSADGKKFSRYAQGLTLARLTELANRHLNRLSDRYRILKTPGMDLTLEIVDSYQADISRPMSTLSGGESFLVSLALALGLSELSSRKTPIHSLFIDEGFGTLDAETLEIAITALENLQARGKTIGIISHVDALKERIGTLIKVEKQTGGYSVIKIES